MSVTFRCYAYGNGQNWQAICTDLDIAVDGASLEDVRESLTGCIDLYLEGLDGLPVDERQRFLARKAPWHLRTKLAILTWLHRHLQSHAGPIQKFTLQSHLPVLP